MPTNAEIAERAAWEIRTSSNRTLSEYTSIIQRAIEESQGQQEPPKSQPVQCGNTRTMHCLHQSGHKGRCSWDTNFCPDCMMPLPHAATSSCIRNMVGVADTRELREALRKLRHEVLAILGIAGAPIRATVGDTNMRVLNVRLAEAERVLAQGEPR